MKIYLISTLIAQCFTAHVVFALQKDRVTEEVFHQTINKIETIYAPIVQSRGGQLSIKRRWQDPIINADSDRDGAEWLIYVYGGLARFESITPDAFALILCHEVGHHLGGAPRITPKYWGSTEGQADYFSTLKCLRRFWENEDLIWPKGADPIVESKCQSAFTEIHEQIVCVKSAMAGLHASYLYQYMNNEKTPARFSTPDSLIVSETNRMYPSTQCRLDTYLAGALCARNKLEDVDFIDSRVGTCDSIFEVGGRPLCWFKP